jgi:hypothetical protein
MEKRRRAEVLCTIAVVLGLHLSIVWMLLTTSRAPSTPATSERLEFVFIVPPVQPAASMGRNPRGRVTRMVSSQRRNVRDTVARAPNLPAANDQDNAIHLPPDWATEMSRTARDAVSNKSAQNTRDFGFPHSPAAKPDKPAQFGWDYAATHRIESLPEGGLLVHLDDNCVLVLFPLPFIGCGIGKNKANGELFEHMRDP